MLEAKVDAALHWKGVEHEHEVHVPGLPYIADFKISDGSYIEVAGMMRYPRYHQKLDKKMGDYQRNGVKVQYLFHHDVQRMWEGCPLPVLSVERRCSDCALVTMEIVNGRCRPCNRKHWGAENAKTETCAMCREAFLQKGGTAAKFCSRTCYWKSLEFSWPSWEDIDRELQTKTVAQVAREIGVEANTLHQRLYRRKRRSTS